MFALQTNDKIALGILALIMIAAIVSSTPTNRIFFDYILVFYVVVYLLNRFFGGRRSGRREARQKIARSDTEKALEEEYWSDVGQSEKPEGGDIIPP